MITPNVAYQQAFGDLIYQRNPFAINTNTNEVQEDKQFNSYSPLRKYHQWSQNLEYCFNNPHLFNILSLKKIALLILQNTHVWSLSQELLNSEETSFRIKNEIHHFQSLIRSILESSTEQNRSQIKTSKKILRSENIKQILSLTDPTDVMFLCEELKVEQAKVLINHLLKYTRYATKFMYVFAFLNQNELVKIINAFPIKSALQMNTHLKIALKETNHYHWFEVIINKLNDFLKNEGTFLISNFEDGKDVQQEITEQYHFLCRYQHIIEGIVQNDLKGLIESYEELINIETIKGT